MRRLSQENIDNRINNGGRVPLSFEERKLIEKGVKLKLTWKQITDTLPMRRSYFSVRNEVKRNGGRDSYSADKAQQAIYERAERKKKILAAFCFDPAVPYQGREVRYKRSVEERLYALEEQIKMLWEFIENEQKF